MKPKITLVAASAALLLVATGCSNKEEPKPRVEPSALIEKNEALPSWVNTESKDIFTAVGSARYKNQTYTQQKAEAQLIADAALAEKIEKRINSLMKVYHQSTGQGDATLEDVFQKTSSSIASQTISGVVVKDIFIAKDGEMFVRVVIDPKYLNGIVSGSFQTNKIAWQQTQADKAFSTLEKEAKAYRDEKNIMPSSSANTQPDINTSKGA
jgi:hypothetical protein